MGRQNVWIYTFRRPYYTKARILTYSNLDLQFWHPITFWRPYAAKAHYDLTCPMLPIRVSGGGRQYHWRQRPVVNYRKALLLNLGPQAAGLQWTPRELKMHGVNAIQKWVPFTPKCSQKRLRLGLLPRLLNYSEGERLWRLPVWHAKLKIVLTLFKNGFHSHPMLPKTSAAWGSAPVPQ